MMNKAEIITEVMMDLPDIELLGTLIRTGTATETGQVLGLSQPGISARLKRMEKRLGLNLFHREGRRLCPTTEALALFAEAATIFEAQARIEARVAALRMAATQPVCVSATPAIIDGFLAPVLHEAGYDGWRQSLTIRVSDPEDDVAAGLSDLGLQLAIPAPVKFQAEKLSSVGLFAVLRDNHPLTRNKALSVLQTAAEPLVCYDPGWSPLGDAIRLAFVRANRDYTPRCIVPFCSTVCQLVAACGGIGYVDAFTAAAGWPGLSFRPASDVPPVSLVMLRLRARSLRSPAQQLAQIFRRHAAAKTLY